MKILIIRLSSIGDIVLTTPVVRCLKRSMPGAEVHYLCRESYRQLMENNPYVTRVWDYKEPMDTLIAELQEQRFDYVVDLQKNARSSHIRKALGVRWTTFPKQNAERCLYVATKQPLSSISHVADRYFEAVRPFQINNDHKGLDYFPTPEATPLGEDPAPYTIIVCGANHFTKTIPPQKIHYLTQQIEGKIVLLGGKGDAERLASEGVEWGSNVVNLCGKTTLNQSALIVEKAALVITPDTGMMHIASAFHRPMIAVWGNTTPRLGFAPYETESVQFEVRPLMCRPCSKLGHQRCPIGYFPCMNRQQWDRIATQANKMLTNRK